MSVRIRSIADGDFFNWLDLYAGYGEFYETPLTDQRALLVWSWLIDRDHELNGIVAVDESNDNRLVGLAHFREFARPLEGDRGLYLDDLFVEPDMRGRGVGQALIAHLKQIAKERRLGVVSWVTAADNDTAMKLYDSVAKRTQWVTYELDPA